MIEEVYFYLHFKSNGEVEQSSYFDSLVEAMNERALLIRSVGIDIDEVSPVMKGYV